MENLCESTTQIFRPSVEESQDACQVLATTMTSNPLRVSSKLRPAKKSKTEIESSCIMNSSEDNVVVNNVVVNLGTLSILVAAFTHTCEQQNPRVKIEKKRQGLCITATTECFMWISSGLSWEPLCEPNFYVFMY